jgi:mannose-1-phosphate guanylyltransferase
LGIGAVTRPPPALLLAAGLGTRLSPLTDHLPKCLMPIGGRPLLGLWLDLLGEAGFEDIAINTHHQADKVADYVARTPQANRVRLVHEPELLGTGGTIARAGPTEPTSPLLIVHADNLSLFDLRAFLQAHADRPRDVVLTMMTFDPEDPRQCGVVELGDEGRVIGFHEKVAHPPTRLANAAIYIAEPEVIALIRAAASASADGHVDFSTQILPGLMGRILAVHNALYHRDIGSPRSLARAQVDYPAAEGLARSRGLFTPSADPADLFPGDDEARAAFASALQRLGICTGPGSDDLP